ncbi:hypothetical protein E4U54_004986 [Claviceps lovelessii]|nr:hypothetical protein E4U54_004986 [Claviceps lovelessii]
MHTTALVTILAVGASVRATSDSDTVFLTAKTTHTKIVTHCADSYTDCPLSKSFDASAATTPATHTTVSGAPTATTTDSSTTGLVLMPTGAATGLRAQNGAAAVAVAAVIAMVY